MVVYKKVSKRRRKRTGSKRKITKPRNKRMNRSRQMGGSALPALTPDQLANLTAVEQTATDQRRPIDLEYVIRRTEPLDEGARQVGVPQATERAAFAGNVLQRGVENQQKLCNNIKGSIGNLINRVKKCENTDKPINLSELAKALNKILENVVLLNGQCEGLGDLLKLLEQRLLAAGCLESTGTENFNRHVAKIDGAGGARAGARARARAPLGGQPPGQVAQGVAPLGGQPPGQVAQGVAPLGGQPPGQAAVVAPPGQVAQGVAPLGGQPPGQAAVVAPPGQAQVPHIADEDE